MDWHEKMPRQKQRYAFLVGHAHSIDLVAEKSWAHSFRSVGFRSVTLINARGIPHRSHGYFLWAIHVGFLTDTADSRYPWGPWAAPTGISYRKYARVLILTRWPRLTLHWYWIPLVPKCQSTCHTRNCARGVAPDWTDTRNHGYGFCQYPPNTGVNSAANQGGLIGCISKKVQKFRMQQANMHSLQIWYFLRDKGVGGRISYATSKGMQQVR